MRLVLTAALLVIASWLIWGTEVGRTLLWTNAVIVSNALHAHNSNITVAFVMFFALLAGFGGVVWWITTDLLNRFRS